MRATGPSIFILRILPCETGPLPKGVTLPGLTGIEGSAPRDVAAAFANGSFAVGIMLGYAINTWFVFRVPWNWKKMVAYPLVYLIQYVVGLLLLSLVVERGWIPQSELVHYKLHAEIDKRHAAEFFAAIETADEQMMTAGLALGLHLFDQLYASFLR